MKKRTSKMTKISWALTGLLIYVAGFLTGVYRMEIALLGRPFSTPAVSVIMPTYNRGESISSAIESILDQSFTDFEFIIVDDGSTDNTADVIKKYADKDSRIVYVKNKTNQGIVGALNLGLKRAKGQYIARMDDDDFSFKGRLERQVRTLDNHPEITVLATRIGSQRDAPISEKEPEIENPKRTEINTYYSSGLAHPTIMIRKGFLDKHNIRYSDKYQYAEDCNLYKDILNAGGLLSTIKEPLLHFRAVKDLKRVVKYNGVQGVSFRGVQREKLAHLGLTANEDLLGAGKEGAPRCQLLRQMKSANQKSHILNDSMLQEIIEETCPKIGDNAISVIHPYWKDTFIREGKMRLARFSNNDKATVIAETPTSITIKWDKWDNEIYDKKDDKTFVYKQNVNGVIKKTRK